MDWKATLINFLTPGRNGMPLNYVIRDNVAAIDRTKTNFLGGYVNKTSLTGWVFNADAPKVHFYIGQLISENSVSEHKLLHHKDASDGCVDYFTLQEFYEGVRENAKAILAVEKYIQ